MASGAGGGSVYSQTVTLDTRTVTNWYDHYFKPFTTKPSVLKIDLPAYSDGITTVTITKTSGLVGCGSLVIGTSTYIGETQHGAEAASENFSTISREFDGTAILVPRRTIPIASTVVNCDKGIVKNIMDLQILLNAVPAVYSGVDDNDHDYFEPLLILGVYKRWTISLAYAEVAVQNLECEEV
jgi:hypothetical protein